MRPIRKIILHCSDTPDFSPKSPMFDKYGKADIDRWHKAKGWEHGCGYHYIVRRSGKVQVGRPEEMIGAHCLGENAYSIGVCYVGTSEPTTMQVAALYALLTELTLRYKLDYCDIYPHHAFNAGKRCPGFDMSTLIDKFHEYQAIPW